jgi:hypothetical protein
MKKETMFVIGAVALGFIATSYFLRNKKAKDEATSNFGGSEKYFCSATGKTYNVSNQSQKNMANAECMRNGGTLTRGLWALTGGSYAEAERKSGACGCGS